MRDGRLPEADSIEELALFWDSHDVTEFEDQLEEVSEPVFRRPPGEGLGWRSEPK